MNTLLFAILGHRMLPSEPWLTFQAAVISSLTAFWFQAAFWFWVQMALVVIGVAWCVVMASTLLFGGWYASTHPTTGNDLVIRRIVRLLRVLTFGLTDAPSPNLKSGGITQETEEGQEAPSRSILSGR
jgi:hypothetical protein